MPRTHFLNVKKLLEDRRMNKTEIGRLLFPSVKFPQRAFSRILTGEAELSASQVSILAEKLGCEISDLYEPDRWIWKDTTPEKHIFIYGNNFRVEVDLASWNSVVFYKDDIILKGEFCDGNTTLREFFDRIQTEIQNWIDLS